MINIDENPVKSVQYNDTKQYFDDAVIKHKPESGHCNIQSEHCLEIGDIYDEDNDFVAKVKKVTDDILSNIGIQKEAYKQQFNNYMDSLNTYFPYNLRTIKTQDEETNEIIAKSLKYSREFIDKVSNLKLIEQYFLKIKRICDNIQKNNIIINNDQFSIFDNSKYLCNQIKQFSNIE